MAITTPDAVPGELITAAWGDAVRADLNTHETAIAARVPLAGGVMTGHLNSGVGGGVADTAGYTLTGAGTALGSLYSTIQGGSGAVTDTANLRLNRTGTGAAGDPAGVDGLYVGFMRFQAALIGSIRINGSATGVAYNTTSDPRIKTPPPDTRADGDDFADRAHQLGAKAWRGQYLNPDTGEPDGETCDLLSSHDIEDVAPYAVTGERDAVDTDGNPVYQQVDFSALVPLLFGALADALDRIAVLEGAGP